MKLKTKTIKNPKTNKQLQDECVDKFNDYIAKQKYKKYIQHLKTQTKKIKQNKTLSNTEKKKQLKMINKTIKNLNITKIKKNLSRWNKYAYCNIGCKTTVLEPGPPNELPKQFEKRIIKNHKYTLKSRKKLNKPFKTKNNELKQLIKTIKKLKPLTIKQQIENRITERKKIFGNNTNVLNDNFYEKISEKDKKYLKSKGAISYCKPFYNGLNSL